MRRLLFLAALLPAVALAQSTRIVGPNGSGATETAKVTSANGLAVDVSRVQGANTTTSCAMNGAATTCQIALLGKSSCGIQVTANNASTGITTYPEISLDGGTTWQTTTFDNASTYAKTATLTAFAVKDTYQIILSGGATHCRIRNSARTSGDYTAQLTASDTQDPSEVFSGPAGSPLPPAAILIGGNDATTANLVTAHIQPVGSTMNEALLVQGAGTRTASPAYSAGQIGVPSMNVAGSQFVQVGDVGGTIAALKGSGAAAASTDSSLVVNISPNSPVHPVKIDQTTPGTTNGVVITPTTTSAGLAYASGTVNTAAVIKGSAGSLYGAAGQNTTTTAACWLTFYNAASGAVCGTSIVYALPISGSAGLSYSAPSGLQLFNFGTGISVCCGAAPTGSTTCPGTCNFTIYYK